MSWESPIDTMVSDMEMKLEGEVFRAVQRVGITVDKDELIKALEYDRGQYEKGYADAMATIIPCEYCKFAEEITKNADLNYLSLLHCTKWRGEPVHNVWIKYKKVYADFSIVEKDDFCSSGERKLG
jgi:hypothetical protein